MATVKAQKASRRGYKLNMSKELKTINEIISQLPQDDADIHIDLQAALEKLQIFHSKIESLDSQILDSIVDDDEALENEIIETSQFRGTVLDAIKKGEAWLRKYTANSKCVDNDNASLVSATTLKLNRESVKLPKLHIESFDGDALKWQTFWDNFQSTIDNNPELPDIDKFKYLKSYLSSQALKAIDGYRVTSNNYSVVVDVLKQRFGNPEYAIFAHFEKLLAMPPGDSQSVKLQEVYDECEKHIRSLVALGLDESIFGQVFTPIILSEIPRSIRIQLHRSSGSATLNLSKLRDLLKEEISARQMSDWYASTSVASTKDTGKGTDAYKDTKHFKPAKKNYTATNATLVQGSDSKVSCTFCNENHYADQCTKYKTIEERKAQLNGKCFKCLGSGHDAQRCKRKNRCFFCKMVNHHSSLCYSKFGKPGDNTTQKANETQKHSKSFDDKAKRSVDSNLFQSSQNVLMQMAHVSFSDKNVSARLLFDTGSSRSYVTAQMQKSLDSPILGQETIFVSQFGAKKHKPINYAQTSVCIPTHDGCSVEVSALVTDSISCPLSKYPLDISSYPLLSKLQLSDSVCNEVERVTIDILIGSDHYFDFIGTERLAIAEGLYLLDSKLGYIPTGKVDHFEKMPNYIASLLQTSERYQTASYDLERLWCLDEIGIKDNPYQSDDEQALDFFNSTVKFREGRYYVRFPWKSEHPFLPDDFTLAMGRLKSLVRRISDQQNVVQEYQRVVQDQVTKGIIEQVNPRKTDSVTNKHYIPHHCVIKENKATTKLRVVYDASARTSRDNPSLNDCLHSGPVFLQDLLGMIMRFRLGNIAISCDVEKAFLQVGLQEIDRDVTRFLWPKNWNEPITNANVMIYRFCRVPFGIDSSPFLLAATIKYHLNKNNDEVSTKILQNLYVDNVLVNCNSNQEAFSFYTKTKRLFSDISMNIREWYSNNRVLMENIPLNDHGKDKEPKIMGLTWNTKEDELHCGELKYSPMKEVTKRHILQVVSTVFDPCGFFAPVVVRGKLLIQDLWKRKVRWDERVPSAIYDSFHSSC